MNIVLIAQDEPFYLAKNIQYLIKNLPTGTNISACVVLSPSPYEKSKSLLEKARDTRNIFGNKFFFHYMKKYIIGKFNKRTKVLSVLKKNAVKPIFLKYGINHKHSVNIINQYSPDLLISILGNEIFKKPILDLAPLGCLNLHTSLLPKYRGLMPTFWVLKNNEHETGVSVFFVDEGIDSGDIIFQEKIRIASGTTQEQLINKTKSIGMRLLIQSIDTIKNGTVTKIENNDNEATYYSLPTRDDVKNFLKSGGRFY